MFHISCEFHLCLITLFSLVERKRSTINKEGLSKKAPPTNREPGLISSLMSAVKTAMTTQEQKVTS